MKKVRWNGKKLLKNVGKLILLIFTMWSLFSVIDYGFARTMYGENHLSEFNILVVTYKWLTNILSGFTF